MGSGGFRGVYSGLLSTFIGSAPNGICSFSKKKKKALVLISKYYTFRLASIFFVTYEAVKRMLGASNNGLVHSPFIYMTAASCGEIVCAHKNINYDTLFNPPLFFSIHSSLVPYVYQLK